MNKEKLIPKLRFNDFEKQSKWISLKLEDIGNTFNGLSGKTKKDFGHGKAEFVTYMNVFSNTITDIKRTEQVEIDKTQHEVQYGDVFFTTSSETPHEVGMSSVWLDNRPNVYLNSFCFGFRPMIELDHYYFAYMLKSPRIRQKFIFLAQGISRYNISKTKAMKISVWMPNIFEQKNIGSFFKTIDQMIRLQQSKVNKVKDIKSAYLSEMFPKEGEIYPKKRFEGFTEPWYKNKFNEITEYITSSLSANNTLIQGRYELYDANELIGYTNSSGQKQEYVTIIKDGSGVGRVRLLPKDSNFIGTMGAIVNKEQTDIHYIYAYLQQFNFTEFITGATVPHVYYRDYGESIDYHPSYEEQVKIGKFFKNLDNQISKEEEKLEKLKKLKQAYLNDMFV